MPGNAYLWQLMDSVYSGAGFTKVFRERGNYSLFLRSALSSCVDSLLRLVSVQDPPLQLKADFKVQLEREDCNSIPIVRIENTSLGADRSIWQWDGNSSFSEVPQINPVNTDSIELKLLAYKGFCLNEKRLKFFAGPLLPPNLVTIEMDGKNDVFEIPNLPDNSFIEIRDRWGKLVFKEDAYQNNWKPDEVGTYFYQIRFPEGGNCRSWLQVVR